MLANICVISEIVTQTYIFNSVWKSPAGATSSASSQFLRGGPGKQESKGQSYQAPHLKLFPFWTGVETFFWWSKRTAKGKIPHLKLVWLEKRRKSTAKYDYMICLNSANVAFCTRTPSSFLFLLHSKSNQPDPIPLVFRSSFENWTRIQFLQPIQNCKFLLHS